MKSFFVYNGICSADFGISIEKCPERPIPQKRIERISVPGRNGDLTRDTGTYENVVQTYEIYYDARDSAATTRARQIALWLMSASGYVRLEDSYEPDFYRMGMFVGPVNAQNWMKKFGRIKLDFECKPQWFSKFGEQWITIASGQQLYNGYMTAKPLIRVYGTDGKLIVGNTIIRIDAIDEYIDLDCEIQNAYKGVANCNSNIYAPEFPTLPPGLTGITWSGNITKVEIMPRWWTI